MATMTAASHVAKSACALARAGSRQQSTQQTGSLAALAPARCVVSERLRFGPLLLPASQVSPLPLTSSADSLCCLVHIHLPVAGALPGTAVPDLPTANALVQAGGAQTSSCKVMPQASSLSITQQGELCQRGLIEFPSISHLDSSSPVYYIHGSERLTFSSTSVPEMRIDRLLSAPTLDELQGILQQVQTGPSQEGRVSA